MIIQRWDVKKDGRQIKKTFTGKWLNGEPVVKISGSLVLVVITSRPDLLPLTLLDLMREAGAPAVGDVYTEGSAWIERTFYADATPRFIGPNGAGWEWEVTYSIGGVYVDAPTPTNSNESNDSNETLLTFTSSIELEDYASAADLNGEWNCNSNGEFFADPLIFKNGVLTMVYNYREYANPLETSRRFFQKVNADAWYSFPAGSVKCADINFTATQTAQETYYDTTYKLQYRPLGWTVDKANSGFYYLNGSSLTRALNADGSPTSEPVLLNAQGGLLASGNPPVIKRFVVNASENFDDLNLPDPFSL